MAANADAVVQNVRPGVVDRLGVGYEAVAARNPKIVYCSIAGYGFSGPYAAYFTELMERQKGADYFIGGPRDLARGECKDSFAQVMNSAFPGGLLSVDQAIKMMNTACFKG